MHITGNFRRPVAPAAAACLALALLPGLATAAHRVDVRLLDRTTAKPTFHRLALELGPRAFAVDTTALRGTPSSLLCRADDALYLIDRRARTYQACDLRTLTGASSAMRRAGELLAPGLADLLPAGTVAGPAEVRPTAQRREIGGLPCQLFVVTRDGAKVQDIWATPWDRVSAPRSSLDLVKQVAAAWSTVAAGLNAAGTPAVSLQLDGLLRIDAYPVMVTHYAQGRALYEVRLGAPRPLDAAPAAFAVPAGYTRRALSL